MLSSTSAVVGGSLSFGELRGLPLLGDDCKLGGFSAAGVDIGETSSGGDVGELDFAMISGW